MKYLVLVLVALSISACGTTVREGCARNTYIRCYPAMEMFPKGLELMDDEIEDYYS